MTSSVLPNGSSHNPAASGIPPNMSSAPQMAPSPANGQTSIPPQAQQVLMGLTKERLQQMVMRMQQLKAGGATEQTNQEYATLVQTLRTFQQVQAYRQQAALQARANNASGQANGASASSTPPTAPSPAAAVNGQQKQPPAPLQADGLAASADQTRNGAASKGASQPTASPTQGNESNGAANFTPEQLAALKTQIIAFKLISRSMPLPAHLQAAIFSPDKAIEELKKETADVQELGVAGKVAEAAVTSHLAAEAVKASQQVKAEGQAPRSTPDGAAKEAASSEAGTSQAPPAAKEPVRAPSPVDDPTSSVYPYNAYTHPFSYLSKPSLGRDDYTATKQQRLLIPSLMPAGLDPHLLLEERDRFTKARIQQRIRELEALPANMSELPTVASIKGKENERTDFQQRALGASINGDNAKIKALIELKSLQLLDRQKALREQVVRGMSQATTLALDRTAFRRFKKQTLRDARMTEQLERKQRVEREKRARQKHTDYLQTICNHGREMIAAQRNAQTQAQKLGRLVLKLHADTEREEQKRIERIAKERLSALKNDDEEAYLKLIDTAKDTRITHLLRQTDSYLDSLAQAVQAQQNDDVHAEAIAAEKAGMMAPTAEELADQTRNQEIGVAVDETMFGATRQDDPSEDKGKVDYYAVAHRITERITEQPTILVGGKLKEYQIKGLQWMVSLYNNRLNGILADEMGLGKTIQTISLITFLIEHKKQNGPYLVIVPLSTLTNWVNEFDKWAPGVSVLIYKGVPNVRKQLTARIRQGSFQVLLTTYEYIIKDKPLLGKIKWVHMIIDEGHRMKNTQSKLTVTLTQFYTSRYRLLLTGTPLQNNLPELWALLNFVLPKIFNSVKSFDEWFNTPFANTGTGDGSMQLNEEEALLIIRRLHKVLRPFLLRRLKKDVESELPDKVEKVIKCKMSALQSKLYQQMKKHKIILSSDSTAQKGKPTGIRGLQNAIMQLRKICNHPYVFEQVEAAINPSKENGPDLYRVSGKFELLDRILPKLFKTGHRVLIFFQMTAIMDIMEDFMRFRGFKYLRLDGSTKPDDRSVLLKEFNAPNSEYFIFILSTRAGGLGLNLQTADTVIIYDSDWNPHQDLQAQDRAHRIGQKMEVRILRLVTEKSVEETILARAQYKLEIDGKVIQAGKFDNQATADEREVLLRAMLEADNEDEDEEEGDLNDEELNQILARGDTEEGRFKEIDEEREAKEEADWRASGGKGKKPDRLMQETELPDLYQQDFDADNVLEDMAPEDEPAVRKRNVVHYDDGLTEDQFLRALEDEDGDLQETIDKKRERAEKRRAKAIGLESEAGTPVPDGRKRKGKGRDDTPEASPGPGARKRKRLVDQSPAGTPEYEQEVSRAAPKRRKTQGDDDVRDRIKAALLQCYRAVESCYEPESGRKRCQLFLDIPKKTDYPDYHVLIARPICMRQIKRRIDNRTFRSVATCRDEFHLMVSNAKTYNQEGSWVYNDAVELQAAFDRTYDLVTRGSGLPGAEGGPSPDGTNSNTGTTEDQNSPMPSESPAPTQSRLGMKIRLSVGGKRGPVGKAIKANSKSADSSRKQSEDSEMASVGEGDEESDEDD